jgi:hypothetical protein
VKTGLVSFGGFCSIDVVFVVARLPLLATKPSRLNAYLLGFAPVCKYISNTLITAT